MSEEADLVDPGDGEFRSVLRNVSLSQHEIFENSQAEFFTPAMGNARKERRRRARENRERSLDNKRSRSVHAPSERSLEEQNTTADSNRSQELDSQIPPGQNMMTQPPITATPPAHLIADTPDLTQTESPASLFTPVGRERYTTNDQGPYIVHIQKIETAPDSGVTLHPVTFGLFLQKRKREFHNIIEGSVKRIGRNRVSLGFHSAEDANSFLDSPTLMHNKYKAFLPTFNVTRMGLVRGVPAEWSPEEVLEQVQVPVNSGGARPIKVRRLNFKKNRPDGTFSWLPSESVVITFDGQSLPKRVYLCLNSLPVETYQYPTVQCFKCCRFGHTKEKCRSLPRCFRCGGGHVGESCEVDVETHGSLCCNCPRSVAAGHFANSKSCPEYARQIKIKKTMTDENISYIEASNLHAKISQRSYANVTSAPLHSPTVLSYKKTVFRQPRSPPQLDKGYDRRAHEALTRDPVVESRPIYPEQRQSRESVISELIKLLSSVVKVLSPSSPLSDPSLLSHAAPFISSFLFPSNNGSSSSSVEHSQYH